jgi:hypothetical protein
MLFIVCICACRLCILVFACNTLNSFDSVVVVSKAVVIVNVAVVAASAVVL